jgi:hypothetical protein
MTTASPANLELAIVLPLGVVANQLMKVEADLRSLSMRAGAIAGGDGGASRQVAGQVEKISATLDSLRRLLADFEADIQPKPKPDRDD